MKVERLAAMVRDAVSFDTETHLFQPGLAAPPLVTASVAAIVDGEVRAFGPYTKDEARARWRTILRDRRYTYVNANCAFDAIGMMVDAARLGEDVVAETFDLYDPERTIVRGTCDGRVFDILSVEQLHAIAQGHLGKYWRTLAPFKNNKGKSARYSQAIVVDEVLAESDAKANDAYRLRYAELENVPIAQWPEEARVYPLDDTRFALRTGLAQAGHLPSANPHEWENVEIGGKLEQLCRHCRQVLTAGGPGPNCMRRQPRRNLHDLSRQAYAWFALSLSATHGFRINHAKVDALEQKYVVDRKEQRKRFVDAGILREDGSECQARLYELVARAYGATDPCPTCAGDGKVPSPKTNGRTKINCKACSGTGLLLTRSVPRSATGLVSCDRDALQESGDDLLLAYLAFGEGEKIETTYIPLMRSTRLCDVCGRSGYGKDKHSESCVIGAGQAPAAWREVPLLPSPNHLVETGRCSYLGGIHGLPRKGGVRECFEAPPGWVLSSEDYTSGELVTHAENCIRVVGYSRLAEALNAGLDAHLDLAGLMSGRSYEAMLAAKKAKEARATNDRQAAKAGNFGFGGGMAELTFTTRKRSDPDIFTPCPLGPEEHDGVRGYPGLRTCILMAGAERCGERMIFSYKGKDIPPVCELCLKESKRLREFWFKKWPENRDYQKRIQEMVAVVGPSGTSEIAHHNTLRVRGGVSFTDGANGLFQGLLADAMKNAYCAIVRECYDRTCRVRSSEMMTSRFDGGESPLFRSRALLLAHDEAIMAHPESVGHEAAHRTSEIMVEALRFACPRMYKACKAEPTLMRFLAKGAEPRYHDSGTDKPANENDRLVPWEPKKAA